MHIRLDNFNTYEDTLTKALQVEMGEEYRVSLVDSYIEEQLEIMQNSIQEISLKGNEFWCMRCSTARHTKYYCQQEEHQQEIEFVQLKCFCDIC